MENERDRVSPSNKWNIICIFIFSGSAKACRMDAQNLLFVCMHACLPACLLAGASACYDFILGMHSGKIIQMQHIDKQSWWRRWRISIIIIIIAYGKRKWTHFDKLFSSCTQRMRTIELLLVSSFTVVGAVAIAVTCAFQKILGFAVGTTIYDIAFLRILVRFHKAIHYMNVIKCFLLAFHSLPKFSRQDVYAVLV